MLHYINIEKKKLVGRNNQPNTLPIVIDYSTVEDLSFQFINNQNQIQPISGLSGLYIAGSLGIGQPSYDLLFLSKDYTIENDVLTFSVDTYTRNYLDKIKKKNTEINLEIGQISLNVKKLLLRDYALACPRVYVEGLTPQEIDSHDYWTIEETQEAIDNAIEGISGFVTEEQFEEGLSTKQDVIDADNKLDYALISGTPTIPTKTSDLTNDSDFQTGTDVQTALNVKQDVIDANNKLAYDLLSGTPSIPTKTSDLQNDSGFITDSSLQGLASETYVDNAVSGKADTSALTAHTSDTTIHVTSADKTAWNGKQDAIDSNNKLDYALISGTPTIPTKTSDLQNDSGFITDSALSGKQDVIDANNKLAYSLLSGTPTIPTKTSDLTNDSGFITNSALQGYATETYVDAEVSGKLDVSGYVAPYRLPFNKIQGPGGTWFQEDIGATMDWSDTDIIPNDKKIDVISFVTGSENDNLVFPTLYSASTENVIKTCEVWVKMEGSCSAAQGIAAIIVPASYYIVDEDNFPTSLKGEATNNESYTYHIFVIRAVPRQSGTICEVCYSHYLNTNLSI